MKLRFPAYILCVIVVLTSCVATKNKHYTFNRKYPAVAVRNDISLLKKILEANHPSLYWYTSKDSVNYYFDSITNSITDSITEIQAKNKIAFAVAKIKCGHTSVRFSRQFVSLAEKNRYPQFPLSIKTWKDSMVVLGRYNSGDSMFVRGTIITAINGRKNESILNEMFPYISTDGNADNYKSQAISNNFPGWYRNVFGADTAYAISYVDSLQQERTVTIKAFSPKKDTTKKVKDSTKLVKPSAPKIPNKQKRQSKLLSYRSMVIDTALNVAYMRVTTFSNGRLRRFFRKSFKEIQQRQIKNIVIDVRENGGGSVAASTLLIKYLKNSPFKLGDTIAAKSKRFEYGNHIKNWLGYWFLMQFVSSKKEDGLYHNTWMEQHTYHPKATHHFNGDIYILQGGHTFSAATIFSSMLKGQANVTLVGEETGGGYYGNSAMHIPNIILPNTKLQVRLPIYRYVMDKNRPKGRGVMPDVEILPSSDAIKKGIDLKLEAVKKIIQNRQRDTAITH